MTRYAFDIAASLSYTEYPYIVTTSNPDPDRKFYGFCHKIHFPERTREPMRVHFIRIEITAAGANRQLSQELRWYCANLREPLLSLFIDKTQQRTQCGSSSRHVVATGLAVRIQLPVRTCIAGRMDFPHHFSCAISY